MNKKVILGVILMAGSGMTSPLAQADQNEDIVRCTTIQDNNSRLACFDAAAKAMVESKDAAKAQDQNPTINQKIDNFGKAQLRSSSVKKVREEQKKEAKKDLDKITLTVERYIYTNSKKFVLIMKNGQVWKQHSGKKIRFPKEEFTVEISKSLFGSFNMTIPNGTSLIKVKRLK